MLPRGFDSHFSWYGYSVVDNIFTLFCRVKLAEYNDPSPTVPCVVLLTFFFSCIWVDQNNSMPCRFHYLLYYRCINGNDSEEHMQYLLNVVLHADNTA